MNSTTPDDAQLMAYADGELDAATRSAIEQALAANPALAQRVQAHEALRQRVTAAFAGALNEPVPDRLLQVLGAVPTPSAPVVDLGAARAARAERDAAVAARVPVMASTGQGWARWGGLAASLALGVLLGTQWSGRTGDPGDAQAGVAALVARGAVARALDTQAAGTGDASSVSVAFSFLDRQGRYCRTFTASTNAGLACRDGGNWAVQALVPTPVSPAASAGGLRQAATALPAAVLQAVDERIAGEALGATEERAALQRGWAR